MDPWQPCPASDSDPISLIETTSAGVDADVVNLALHNGEKTHEEQDNHHHQPEEISEPDNSTNSNQSGGEDPALSFGDNFQPFVKLPDSQEYLQSLEKKLKTIQKGGRKGPSADSILRSLGQTKESCMLKLLSNSVEKLTIEGEIFEELKVNPLLKKLAPEKQALSAEELVHLLKADQLELILGNLNPEEEEASTSLEPKPDSESESSTTATAAGPEVESSKETEKDRDSTENLASSVDHPLEKKE